MRGEQNTTGRAGAPLCGALATALLLGACRGPSELVLPEDWARGELVAFEAWVEERFAGEDRIPLSRDAALELEETLGGESLGAVRAAVVLGRSRSAEAEAILLARLERRIEAEARHADAGDVVAAAALLQLDPSPDTPLRLEKLAVGARPHGDLQVRVECAATALAFGRDGVVPFLLRILRAGTPAGRADLHDWTETRTLYWVKSRAAVALSQRAGAACTFEPDASFAAQEREARLLAERLGVTLPAPPLDPDEEREDRD